jgi:chaperone required for assembly of F1-ATPase
MAFSGSVVCSAAELSYLRSPERRGFQERVHELVSANKGRRIGSGREARSLPKRFYKSVTIAAAEGEHTAAFGILLDGKPARTPAKALLAVPTRALAEAIAGEWEAQCEHIDPATMPLTRIANSAIDGVRAHQAKVCADIAKYAASDLLCYRATEPELLVRRQAELWDPVLAWGRDALGARFAVAKGIMPVAQPEAAISAVARALEDFDTFGLAALHVMTTLTGSALLALAHARGHLTAEAAWAAAHVDEDWQIGRWGEDAEAAARRRRRWSEMEAASRLLALLR